jgi:hypothetical protein
VGRVKREKVNKKKKKIRSLGFHSVSVHNISKSYDIIAVPSTPIIVVIPPIGRDIHVVDGSGGGENTHRKHRQES